MKLSWYIDYWYISLSATGLMKGFRLNRIRIRISVRCTYVHVIGVHGKCQNLNALEIIYVPVSVPFYPYAYNWFLLS